MYKTDQVALYGLYGEEWSKHDLGFVHIEKISTRSTLYDWHIEPHAHPGRLQILFLERGGAEVQIDRSLKEVRDCAVICLPGSVVHGFEFQPGTEGWVLTVSEQLLTDERDPRSHGLIQPLMVEPFLVSLVDEIETRDLIASMLERMHAEFNWPQVGRRAMFDWMIRIIIVSIRRKIDRETLLEPGNRKRHSLFMHFRQLLEGHYKSHWPVETYASKLALTAPRLNRLCRSVSGTTAGDLIQDRLSLEAQRLLIYTNATSAMVAEELGFNDPAYFSRFFKRRTGLSPVAFREAQEQRVV